MRTGELGRGTVVGLTFGAFLGAVLLAWLSGTLQPKCAGLSDPECLLEEQATFESQRVGFLSASGLTLLGAGGLWWLRAMRKRTS